MTVWIVCGAARGVGKTHLASRLALVLPNSVRAKLGHGPAKSDGLPNYFRSAEELARFVDRQSTTANHLIIESNAWARTGHGDVVVFLGARPDGPKPRPDTPDLMARAHIRVGCDQQPRKWQLALQQHLRSASQRKAVLDLLHEQATYLGRSRVTARSKTWLVIGDSRTFGGGIARLLREVDATGSVRSAAAACHISYRHSWNLIRSAEQHLKAPLIQPRSGGLGGGNSVLTPQGRYWLALYARLDAAVTECTNREFAMIRDQGPLP